MTGLAPEVSVLALALGLIFALGCYLVTNLSPGGMITPGWIALVLITNPPFALIIGAVAVATYVVSRGIQRIVILYGKRLFATVVLIGVFIQLTIFFVARATIDTSDYTTLGFIIPGLVAYQLIRQPVVATITSTAAVASMAYLVVLAGVELRFVEARSPQDEVAASGLTGAPQIETSALELTLVSLSLVVGLATLYWKLRRPQRRDAPQAELRPGATAKLQAGVAVLEHRLTQSQEEIQAERIGRGTAEAILEKARQDHQAEIGTAEAVLERERVEHEAALKHSKGRAQAALDAERSTFARERSDLGARVQRAITEAEATMAGERSARQRERNEIAGSLGSLRTDIESPIGALREKLETEVNRARSLAGALEQRHETLVMGNRALAEARAGVERALRTSEARAAALAEELAHRRDLVERVGTATAELRGHLDQTRRAPGRGDRPPCVDRAGRP